MNDKEALNSIVFMVNDYVNNRNNKQTNYEFINNLILLKIVKYMRSELFQPMTNEDLK